MSSHWGSNLQIEIFGESHGGGIGVVIDGLPSGEFIDLDELQEFLRRRSPGRSPLTTSRKEADVPEFLSGLYNGQTTGTPLTALIRNTDTRSADYDSLRTIPRPGHADYTAELRYHGAQDPRGGGHFSGRLTAPLCIAGGIARQILAHRDVLVGAHLLSVGGIWDKAYDAVALTAEELSCPARKELPVLDDAQGVHMRQCIEQARQEGDSVGGRIEGAVLGMPGGLGSPMFDGVENRLSSLLFGLPAVKGVEFGCGMAAADLHGSAHNDAFTIDAQGNVRTLTNNHGGILGGITSGMPLIVKVGIKPTPSIAQEQQSVNLQEKTSTALRIQGRHDPCVALRAVPVVEAALACAMLDLLLEGRKY